MSLTISSKHNRRTKRTKQTDTVNSHHKKIKIAHETNTANSSLLIMSIPNENAPRKFNIDWVKPGNKTYWHDKNKKPTIANHMFFRDSAYGKDVDELTNKVVVGLALRITRPDTKSFAQRIVQHSVTGEGKDKKRIAMPLTNTYGLMLVCLDVFSQPNTFAVMFHHTHEFQSMFAKAATASSVRVGDFLAFVNPSMSLDTLGSSMAMLHKPSTIVAMTPPSDFPWQLARRPSNPGTTFGWHMKNKIIKIGGLHAVVGSKEMPCTGVSCDRQNPPCKGCFGKSPSLHPFALNTMLQVNDCPECAEVGNNAVFPDFRSYAFSKLFFHNIETFAALALEDMEDNLSELEEVVRTIVQHINSNGGWTIVGWHRVGERVDHISGDTLQNETTAGHIVRAEPTDSSLLQKKDYLDLLYKTPAPNGSHVNNS